MSWRGCTRRNGLTAMSSQSFQSPPRSLGCPLEIVQTRWALLWIPQKDARSLHSDYSPNKIQLGKCHAGRGHEWVFPFSCGISWKAAADTSLTRGETGREREKKKSGASTVQWLRRPLMELKLMNKNAAQGEWELPRCEVLTGSLSENSLT